MFLQINICFFFSTLIRLLFCTYQYVYIEDYTDRLEHNYELRQNDQENIEWNEEGTKSTFKETMKKTAVDGQEIVDAIVQDPDLSIAHSTVHKSTGKDPDISLDDYENYGMDVIGIGKEETYDLDLFFRKMMDDSNNQENNSHNFLTTKSLDIKKKSPDSPPPLSEITIPKSHDYGYGFYLKPLWNMDSKKTNTSYTERIQKIKNLVKEDRKRRKQKKATKLVRKVTIE